MKIIRSRLSFQYHLLIFSSSKLFYYSVGTASSNLCASKKINYNVIMYILWLFICTPCVIQHKFLIVCKKRLKGLILAKIKYAIITLESML